MNTLSSFLTILPPTFSANQLNFNFDREQENEICENLNWIEKFL